MKYRSFRSGPIGVDDDGFTVLLDLIEPDPDFPAFRQCTALGF